MWQGREEVVFTDENLVMQRLDVARDSAGVRQLAEGILRIADGKSFHRGAEYFSHQSGNGAGIKAATQEDPEWYVAHQVAAHRLLQKVAISLDVVTFGARGIGIRDGQVPVTLDFDLAMRVYFHPVTGHQLADSSVEGFFAGKISESEVLGEDGTTEPCIDSGVRENRFNFRAEDQTFGAELIVERLDAQTIAREEDSLAASVPDGEGEHAAQVLNAVVAVFFVKMDDGFGVATGAVNMSARFELRAQVGVVVDFAVEDDPDGSVFVTQRLLAGGEIDNAQATHTQRGRTVDADAFIIGATVGNSIAHSPQDFAIDVGVEARVAGEL